MAYLYLKYQKEHSDFIKLLDEVKLPNNQNCQLIYKNSKFDFFVLDELVFDICNKIYRIQDDSLLFISDDLPTDDSYPKVKSTSGKLFYKNNNFNFDLDDLTVNESDYPYFVDMVFRTKNYQITERTMEIFMKNHDVRRLLSFHQDLDFVLNFYERCNRKNIFYRCDNEDKFFDLIEKLQKVKKPHVFHLHTPKEDESHYYTEIAVKNITSRTSEENFKKIVGMAIYSKSQYYYSKLFDFYGKQIYGFDWRTGEKYKDFQRLSIFNNSAREILHEIFVINDNRLRNYLLKIANSKIQNGDKSIREDDLFIILGCYEMYEWNRNLSTDLKKELFILTKAPEFKNFDEYVAVLKRNDTIFSHQIFDIFMDNFDKLDVTKEGIKLILKNPHLDRERKDKLMSKNV